MTREQLKLENKQVQEIGFTKKVYPANGRNDERTTFEIGTTNGCFYYNVSDEKYRWYHKTIISEGFNHVHLNIEKLPELFMVLACFKAKYNFKVY